MNPRIPLALTVLSLAGCAHHERDPQAALEVFPQTATSRDLMYESPEHRFWREQVARAENELRSKGVTDKSDAYELAKDRVGPEPTYSADTARKAKNRTLTPQELDAAKANATF